MTSDDTDKKILRKPGQITIREGRDGGAALDGTARRGRKGGGVMTAPHLIYAWGDFGPNSVTGRWSANTFEDESAAPFVSLSVLIAAYDLAAALVQQRAEEYAEFSTTSDEACQQLAQAAQDIAALTPQDAIAAIKGGTLSAASLCDAPSGPTRPRGAGTLG